MNITSPEPHPTCWRPPEFRSGQRLVLQVARRWCPGLGLAPTYPGRSDCSDIRQSLPSSAALNLLSSRPAYLLGGPRGPLVSLWVRSKSSLTSPEAAWKCQDQPAKRNKSGVPPLKTHRVWSSGDLGPHSLLPWAPPLRGNRMAEAQSIAQVTCAGRSRGLGLGRLLEEGPNPGALRRLPFPAAGARALTAPCLRPRPQRALRAGARRRRGRVRCRAIECRPAGRAGRVSGPLRSALRRCQPWWRRTLLPGPEGQGPSVRGARREGAAPYRPRGPRPGPRPWSQ